MPPLSIDKILGWVDSHYEQFGKWPIESAGVDREPPAESWQNLSQVLQVGLPGFPKSGSLAKLLTAKRDVRNCMTLPGLTNMKILD